MAAQAEIVHFLLDFKRAIQAGRWSIVQRRAEYAQETEMSVAGVKLILLSLTPDEYVKGPDADRDRPGEYLWIFHRQDGDRPYFYIKLKVWQGRAKVISFHRTRFV